VDEIAAVRPHECRACASLQLGDGVVGEEASICRLREDAALLRCEADDVGPGQQPVAAAIAHEQAERPLRRAHCRTQRVEHLGWQCCVSAREPLAYTAERSLQL